jgi:NADPH:quinone reductase-like Zn-dependent oxidoreductase
VEFSPVSPSDLSLARASMESAPALPTVIGGEGVGRVIAVGAGVEKNVKVGDRVLALSSFTRRERMVVPALAVSSPCLRARIRCSFDAGHPSPDRGTAAQ